MDHSSHGDMNEAMMCTMNMFFTWNTKGLCIVFKSWQIQTTFGLILSLLAVVLITAGYEALREGSRRYESWVAKKQDSGLNRVDSESTPFFWSGRNQVETSSRAHIVKAILYALQTFYAFMLMLLFMTYNGYIMLAVTVGAFVGFLAFGGKTSATKETACH